MKRESFNWLTCSLVDAGLNSVYVHSRSARQFITEFQYLVDFLGKFLVLPLLILMTVNGQSQWQPPIACLVEFGTLGRICDNAINVCLVLGQSSGALLMGGDETVGNIGRTQPCLLMGLRGE